MFFLHDHSLSLRFALGFESAGNPVIFICCSDSSVSIRLVRISKGALLLIAVELILIFLCEFLCLEEVTTVRALKSPRFLWGGTGMEGWKGEVCRTNVASQFYT